MRPSVIASAVALLSLAAAAYAAPVQPVRLPRSSAQPEHDE
jgi:hypothetical protein